MLRVCGIKMPPIHSKSFGDGLFELRIKAEEGLARAFYTFDKGKIIIILHIFFKKSQKTPTLELQRAKKY